MGLLYLYQCCVVGMNNDHSFSSHQVLRENISVQELGLKDFAQPVKMAHVQLGDKLM
jgi:hypothetical protein